jgi:hypothetical protein
MTTPVTSGSNSQWAVRSKIGVADFGYRYRQQGHSDVPTLDAIRPAEEGGFWFFPRPDEIGYIGTPNDQGKLTSPKTTVFYPFVPGDERGMWAGSDSFAVGTTTYGHMMRSMLQDAVIEAKVRVAFMQAPKDAQTDYVWDVLHAMSAADVAPPYIKMRDDDITVDFKVKDGLVSLLIDSFSCHLSAYLPYSDTQASFSMEDDRGVTQSLRVLKALLPSGEANG